jgi:acyl carrier protein
METDATLTTELKRLLAENLMLDRSPEDWADDLPLFGPDGLGLDSVDALQIVVALDKHYGLKISDADAAREILQNIATIAAAIRQKQNAA